MESDPRRILSRQEKEKLEHGRGAPNSPIDPQCTVCGGKGLMGNRPMQIHCTCRYRSYTPTSTVRSSS